MLKDILTLKGVAVLEKKQQANINGGIISPILTIPTQCAIWATGQANMQQLESMGEFSDSYFNEIANEAYSVCIDDPTIMY